MNDPRETITAIEQPDARLWTYYLISTLITGPLYPVLILPFWFRYHTMRYRFDDEGVSMRWGILFRKEINLTYARIQDIHLVSNFVERWLGLARIQIQTASGSAKAEMTIEGIPQFEQLRDFLYTRMRGARGETPDATPTTGGGDKPPELAEILNRTADELQAIRRLLEEGRDEG